MSKLRDNETQIMRHALGLTERGASNRNHFCTSPGSDDWDAIQSLCALGLMKLTMKPSELTGGGHVFSVTTSGRRRLELEASSLCGERSVNLSENASSVMTTELDEWDARNQETIKHPHETMDTWSKREYGRLQRRAGFIEGMKTMKPKLEEAFEKGFLAAKFEFSDE